VWRHKETGELEDPWFNEDEHQEAIAFCNGTVDGTACAIRNECLIFALVNNERVGVWGGMSEDDRKALRKKWPWRSGSKEPRQEWEWYPPGEARKLLSMKELEAPDEEDDG
jgi:hypothetical protein